MPAGWARINRAPPADESGVGSSQEDRSLSPLTRRTAIKICRAYPSPARGQVTLEFTLAEGAAVELAVHDVLGRRIRALAPGALPAGTHSVRWDGRTAAGEAAGAGLHFVILRTARAEAVARVVRVE